MEVPESGGEGQPEPVWIRLLRDALQESSARPVSVATDHRIVIVDPQLACDICVVRTVTTFARATRSNREEHRNECTKWCSASDTPVSRDVRSGCTAPRTRPRPPGLESLKDSTLDRLRQLLPGP